MKSFLYNLNKTDVDIFFPKERIKKKIGLFCLFQIEDL